jgi:hypothetical protein
MPKNSRLKRGGSIDLLLCKTIPEFYNFLKENMHGLPEYLEVLQVPNENDLYCVRVAVDKLMKVLKMQLAMSMWIDNCNGTLSQDQIHNDFGLKIEGDDYVSQTTPLNYLVFLYSPSNTTLSPPPEESEYFSPSFFTAACIVQQTTLDSFASNSSRSNDTVHYIDIFCSSHKGYGTILNNMLEEFARKDDVNVLACRGIAGEDNRVYAFWLKQGFKRTTNPYSNVSINAYNSNGQPVKVFEMDSPENGYLMMKRVTKQSGGKRKAKK